MKEDPVDMLKLPRELRCSLTKTIHTDWQWSSCVDIEEDKQEAHERATGSGRCLRPQMISYITGMLGHHIIGSREQEEATEGWLCVCGGCDENIQTRKKRFRANGSKNPAQRMIFHESFKCAPSRNSNPRKQLPQTAQVIRHCMSTNNDHFGRYIGVTATLAWGLRYIHNHEKNKGENSVRSSKSSAGQLPACSSPRFADILSDRPGWCPSLSEVILPTPTSQFPKRTRANYSLPINGREQRKTKLGVRYAILLLRVL